MTGSAKASRSRRNVTGTQHRSGVAGLGYVDVDGVGGDAVGDDNEFAIAGGS
jgi:hypothetical protein